MMHNFLPCIRGNYLGASLLPSVNWKKEGFVLQFYSIPQNTDYRVFT